MKKYIATILALFIPALCGAKTFNVSFYSDDSDFDGIAYLSYRLCTNAVNKPICSISVLKQLKFHAQTGENQVQLTDISDNQFIIGYELSTGHKKPPYINSPADLQQACEAHQDGDTLVIQPSIAGLYACNGEMTHL